MMMGYGFSGYLGWLGMGLGMIVHLAFVALIVMAAIWMFNAVFRNNRTETIVGSSAINILDTRYAKGEITSEEYQQMKKEIQ